jgi:putative transcriptional regulator
MIKSRLRILLTEKGLTQRKLSELTGVRPATITGIVNNSIKQIPVDSVSKICKALNCDVGDLFYYEPEQITTPKVNASDLTKRSVSSGIDLPENIDSDFQRDVPKSTEQSAQNAIQKWKAQNPPLTNQVRSASRAEEDAPQPSKEGLNNLLERLRKEHATPKENG